MLITSVLARKGCCNDNNEDERRSCRKKVERQETEEQTSCRVKRSRVKKRGGGEGSGGGGGCVERGLCLRGGYVGRGKKKCRVSFFFFLALPADAVDEEGSEDAGTAFRMLSFSFSLYLLYLGVRVYVCIGGTVWPRCRIHLLARLTLCKVLSVAVGIDRTGQARGPGRDRAG